ncbi:uncharacterized protein LODBEIA_P57160 [Lodderomyces beijingensis]|uniref:ADP-ribose 1''-phosphate phosphatase n=1 Tax=Lodderomyces beijingensis TaxID=1775926 RepID=A0ABP0ZQN3_9ASCO
MPIKYIKGDLFSHTARKPCILAHACNTGGSWGGGIAAVFRRKFPHANQQYSEYCHGNRNLLGTSLLLKGDDFDKNRIYIACLFTSDFQQTPEEIVALTDEAVHDLVGQLKAIDVETDNGKAVINMPKINAGIFGVPWQDTEAVLAKYTDLQINVYVMD